MRNRLYQSLIQEQLALYDKMIFLAGPRQVGKTTIAKSAIKARPSTSSQQLHYLNWDNSDHKQLILQGPKILTQRFGLQELAAAPKKKPIIVFDAIHKFTRWKNFLKGFFDTYHQQTQIIVTGSAKLDVYRSGGDSLRGRYFLYRVHPLSVAECVRTKPNSHQDINAPVKITATDFQALLNFGGFPEPFLTRAPFL